MSCTMCGGNYTIEDSDADQPSKFCSSDCEIDYYENQGPVVDGDDEDELGLDEEDELADEEEKDED